MKKEQELSFNLNKKKEKLKLDYDLFEYCQVCESSSLRSPDSKECSFCVKEALSPKFKSKRVFKKEDIEKHNEKRR